MKLVLLGAGKMGTAMLDGWLDEGAGGRAIEVIDLAPSGHIQALAKDGKITLTKAADASIAPEDVLVLAVKPQIMGEALAAIAPSTEPGALVLSIAAGLSLDYFETVFGPGSPIVRAMPNLPASIGQGMSVAVANAAVSKDQKAICTGLLQAVGEVAWTDKEADMDAVTAVSGSGPAYVFLMVEALAKAGEAEGLAPELALKLARETLRGAGILAATSDLAPGTLRENVTSPGGTTAAALEVLMAGERLEKLMAEAVKAATMRSKELGS